VHDSKRVMPKMVKFGCHITTEVCYLCLYCP